MAESCLVSEGGFCGGEEVSGGPLQDDLGFATSWSTPVQFRYWQMGGWTKERGS